MNSTAVAQLIDNLRPMTLDEMDKKAKLRTRKDRKYLVTPADLASAMTDLAPSLRSLQVNDRRWFSYESLYFDTPDLVSYRLAATRRPSRFKVRTRTYVDSGITMFEVKTKDRRGRTVKVRRPYEHYSGSHIERSRDFAQGFTQVAPHASRLSPSLGVTYRRATVAFQQPSIRATIDAGFLAQTSDGSVSCGDLYIVETKSSGKPGLLDRWFWRAGIRPVKMSKYTTALAAIRPELPSNRWHRVLRNFSFETATTATLNSFGVTPSEHESSDLSPPNHHPGRPTKPLSIRTGTGS